MPANCDFILVLGKLEQHAAILVFFMGEQFHLHNFTLISPVTLVRALVGKVKLGHVVSRVIIR